MSEEGTHLLLGLFQITSLENELHEKEQDFDRLKMASKRELETVQVEWRKEVEQLKLEKQEPIYEVPPEVPCMCILQYCSLWNHYIIVLACTLLPVT